MNNLSIDEKLSLSSYVTYDIETTGLKPDRNYGFIIEIGAVKVIDNKVVDTFNALIKPNISIPKRITEITGIRDEDVINAKSISTVMYDFKNFIGDLKFVIGHNSNNFDWPFIQYWLEETNIELKKENIDVMLMAKELLNKEQLLEREKQWLEKNNKKQPSYSLAALCYSYGIMDKNHHRADNDALITHQLFQALKQEFQEDLNYHIEQNEKNDKKQTIPKNYFLVAINYWEKGKLKRMYVDVTDTKGSTIRVGSVYYDFTKKQWNIKQTPFPILNFDEIEQKTKKIFRVDEMDEKLLAHKKFFFGQHSY